MTTTITSTKVVKSETYELSDFVSNLHGHTVKIDTAAVKKVTLTDGTVSGGYRFFDMVNDAGSLEELVIQRVHAKQMRRGFARVRRVDKVLIEDCVGIGDPTATDKGDVPGGIATADFPIGQLTVRRCDMSSWQGVPKSSYTNGDGVAVEEDVTSLFEDVTCSDNADGGLDGKGDVTFNRGLFVRGHRGLRVWHRIKATDVTIIDPDNAFVWLGGSFVDSTIERLTCIGGAGKWHVKVDSAAGPDKEQPPAILTLIDPVLPAGEELRVQYEGGSNVKVVVKYTAGNEGKGVVATRPALPRAPGSTAPASTPAGPIVITPTPAPTPVPVPATPDVRLAAATARLAEIAAKSAKAPGGSSDKTKQIAALHALAVAPLA